jgi:hypothetical protein
MHEPRSLEQTVVLECDPAGCSGTVGSYDSSVSVDDMRSCTLEERLTAEAAAREDMGASAELETCDYGIASNGAWFLVYLPGRVRLPCVQAETRNEAAMAHHT